MEPETRSLFFNSVLQGNNNIQLTREFYALLATKKARLEFVVSKMLPQINRWVQLPVRPKPNLCSNFQCIFDLRQASDQNFRCRHSGAVLGPQSLFVDVRLANLLLLARLSYEKLNVAPSQLYPLCKAVYSEEQDLHLLIQDAYKITEVMHAAITNADRFRGMVRPVQQKISNAESAAESMKEVGQIVHKYAKKIVESKCLMNQFTSDLSQELANIKTSMDLQNFSTELLTKCIARRAAQPRAGLFTVNNGRLSTTFPVDPYNPTITDIRKYTLTGPDKYENFLGAGWFYYCNRAKDLHMFYAVGGCITVLTSSMMQSNLGATSSADSRMDFRGSIVAWSMKRDGTDLKFHQMLTGDNRLKINCPAVAILRNRGCVYIIGGIGADMVPVPTILEYDVERNSLSEVGTLTKLRYNHSCCVYGENVIIIGGVNYAKYLDGSGSAKIRPTERISDLHSNFSETDLEIFTPGNSRTVIRPSILQISPVYLMLRQVAVILPCYGKDMLVMFAGNCGVRSLTQGPAIAFDMETGVWAPFGENNLTREYVVGQDWALSQNSFIVDFQGYQTENSVTFMVTDVLHSKNSIITFTAKGAQRTYRWVY